MKNFIRRVLTFCTVIAIALIVNALTLRHFADFRIAHDKTMVFMGHSHTQCAYNDSLIDQGVNLASSAESYLYTYVKLKRVIPVNPQINTVFIEYTNNQIDQKMDEWMWDDAFMLQKLPDYLFFLDGESFKLLSRKNTSGLVKCIGPAIRNCRDAAFSGNYIQGIGGYLYLVRDRTNVSLENLSRVKNDVRCDRFSAHNFTYLIKIVEYCQRHQIRVYLIRSPLHSQYPGFQNELVYQKWLKEKLPYVTLLDFSRFPLTNSEFGDFEHLNYRGARKYSEWFNTLIKTGLLEQPDVQGFIDQKIIEVQNQEEVAAVHSKNKIKQRMG